jgi:Spy/CpxP family protein refolding chaperone
MSSKIVVSRETLQRWLDDMGADKHEKAPSLVRRREELRTLLAAPVVDQTLAEHCKQCAEVVRTWPESKRDCLGKITAPVVERQPVAFAWVVVSPDGKEFSELQSSEDAAKDLAHDMDGDLHPDHMGGRHEIKSVYTAPPELAELQATIAQLEDLRDFQSEWVTFYIEKVGELTAGIERLKGGVADAQRNFEKGGEWERNSK